MHWAVVTYLRVYLKGCLSIKINSFGLVTWPRSVIHESSQNPSLLNLESHPVLGFDHHILTNLSLVIIPSDWSISKNRLITLSLAKPPLQLHSFIACFFCLSNTHKTTSGSEYLWLRWTDTIQTYNTNLKKDTETATNSLLLLKSQSVLIYLSLPADSKIFWSSHDSDYQTKKTTKQCSDYGQNSVLVKFKMTRQCTMGSYPV